MAVPRPDAVVTAVVSTAVTTSPLWRPAVAAGLPLATVPIVAPCAFAASWTDTPRNAWPVVVLGVV